MAKKPTYKELEKMVKKLKVEVDKEKQTVKMGPETLEDGIIHDLNNSLQTIFSYTQLILLEKQSDDADFNRLKEIEKAAQRAKEIIYQLLSIS